MITFKNPYLGNTCVPFQHWACSVECARSLEIPARKEQISAARQLDLEYDKLIEKSTHEFTTDARRFQFFKERESFMQRDTLRRRRRNSRRLPADSIRPKCGCSITWYLIPSDNLSCDKEDAFIYSSFLSVLFFCKSVYNYFSYSFEYWTAIYIIILFFTETVCQILIRNFFIYQRIFALNQKFYSMQCIFLNKVKGILCSCLFIPRIVIFLYCEGILKLW